MQTTELELIINLKKKIKQEVIQARLDLKEKEYTLQEINSFLKINCKHKYEQDFVSSGFDDLRLIEYCVYCEEAP